MAQVCVSQTIFVGVNSIGNTIYREGECLCFQSVMNRLAVYNEQTCSLQLSDSVSL